MFIRVMLLDDKKWMSFGGSFKEGGKNHSKAQVNKHGSQN